jgi:hypothetical protein
LRCRRTSATPGLQFGFGYLLICGALAWVRLPRPVSHATSGGGVPGDARRVARRLAAGVRRASGVCRNGTWHAEPAAPRRNSTCVRFEQPTGAAGCPSGTCVRFEQPNGPQGCPSGTGVLFEQPNDARRCPFGTAVRFEQPNGPQGCPSGTGVLFEQPTGPGGCPSGTGVLFEQSEAAGRCPSGHRCSVRPGPVAGLEA